MLQDCSLWHAALLQYQPGMHVCMMTHGQKQGFAVQMAVNMHHAAWLMLKRCMYISGH